MSAQILHSIAIVIGIIGVVDSFVRLRRQIIAIKEFSKRLGGKKEELYKVLGNKGAGVYNRTKVSIDKNKLKELMEEVKQVAEELPAKQKRDVLEPLEQPSFQSRLRYLNKVLKMSGANLNISVHS